MKKIGLVSLLVIGCLVLPVVLVGLMLPQNHLAQTEFDLKASADQVYQVLTDIQGYPSWRPLVKKVEIRDPANWVEYTTDGEAVEYQLEIAVPREKWKTTIQTKDLGYGGYWSFMLAKNGTGSKLTIAEHGEIYNPVFRFIAHFFMGLDSSIIDYGRNLKTKLGE